MLEREQRAPLRRPTSDRRFEDASRLIGATLFAAVVGGFGPVLRLTSEGSGASEKVRWLVVATLSWSTVLSIRPPARRSTTRVVGWILLLAGVTVFVLAATVPRSGRAPTAVMMWAVAWVSIAVGPRASRLGWTGVGATAAAGLLWSSSSSDVLTILAQSIAAATCAAPMVRPGGRVDALDRSIQSTFTELARRAGRATRSAVSSTVHAASELASRPGGRLAAVAIAVSALMVPVFRRLVEDPGARVFGINDYSVHLGLARDITFWPPFPAVPHPVFHVMVRLLDPVLGTTWSPVVLMSVSVGVGAAALAWWSGLADGDHRRLGALGGTVCGVLFVVIESPKLLLIAAGLVERASPAQPLHIWGNPTDTFVLPLLFVLVPAVVWTGVRRTGVGTRRTLALAALTVAATATKPSYSLALIPAIPLWLWVTDRWTAARAKDLGLGVLLPASLVIGVQTVLQVSGALPGATNGFTIDPLALVDVFGWTTGGWTYWLLVVLPLLAVALGGRRFVTERTSSLILLSVAVSAIPVLLLREEGARGYDANLAKTGYFAWVLLVAWSLRFLLLELRDRTASDRAGGHLRLHLSTAAIVVVLGACLVSGLAAYADASGLADLGFNWNVGPS